MTVNVEVHVTRRRKAIRKVETYSDNAAVSLVIGDILQGIIFLRENKVSLEICDTENEN